ncbi:hypothetical protein [Granulosicoccus antarcticus]|uniref:DUF4145 domain-containing protein n=1 Tax=Granulosicoccus antarcticus IMCC3135 TaxID=1192854 RepID=A0A2Z2NQM2_9GAMM|nr:hypothetical protein [Granulosicoccus antarcticus]ASJ73519.1 hypothetical protein IMCC3135_17185 [Granulosicoccus antarcticus IMCC3135]
MDWLEFFASTIDSLAWPGLLAVSLFLLKAPLLQILARISSLKFGGIEADFKEAFGRSPDNADDLSLIDGGSTPAAEPEDDKLAALYSLAELSPRAAVLESWIAVESAARDYIESVGASKNTLALGLDRLPDKARTPIEGVILRYRELRHLRNEAAHANDFDFPSFYAKDFVEEAHRIARVIASKTKNS